ncbi:MAG: hypothetical protein R3A51_01180 [Nannocystaceae bacterium]|nr:hypothetical protein [Myxococcales bacterium]
MGRLVIEVNRLDVIKTDDPGGRDEPYLWVYGIIIDENDQDPGPLRFVLTSDPRPGNLGSSKVKAGESKVIPASVGRFSREINPIINLFVGGILVFAWEHDNTPAQTMKAAYDDCATILDAFLQQRVSTLQLGAVTPEQQAALQADMTAAITARIKQTLKLGTLNFDDNVGAEPAVHVFRDASVAESQALSFNLVSKRSNGRVIANYRVRGELRYTP